MNGGAHLKPLVSILINNYNYAEYLGGAIESALAQTYTNLEVIVVDDGSTDASREIIQRFGGRIVTVFKSNGGQASAFNAGFAGARGDIICFLDSDDLFLPTKVEQVVHALEVRPREWCFHHLQWTDKDLNPIEMPPNPYTSGDRDQVSDVLGFTPPATSGLAFTRRVLEQILPLPEMIRITSTGAMIANPSSDNYLKFASLSLAPGFYLQDQLALQRIHGANAYTGRADETLQADVEIAIALALRERFPALRQVANRMYAGGLARRLRERLPFGRSGSGNTFYLEGFSLIERAELCARVTYKMARHSLKRRVNATI
jgi:glycosyltransferase involved in cell wall biosynthesis